MHKLVGPKFIALVSALVILPFVRAYHAELTHALDLFGSKSPTEQEITGTAGNPSLSELPDFATVAETTMPAVVNISTTPKARTAGQRPGAPNPRRSPFGGNAPLEEFFRRFFGDRPPPNQQRSLGSGFIISSDGYIVTNNHVVGNAETITVRLSDEHEYSASVIGSDEKTDIALIKIDSEVPFRSVPLGESSSLRIGDWVMAIGNPFGLELTVTAGIVSAKGRMIGAGPYDDFIQTDASINPGNSGGPLLNLAGEVVGINSAIFSQGGGNIGIGFAIPIDMAKSIIDQLKTTGKVTRGWLGVAIQTVTAELAKSFDLTEAAGALVAEVTTDGPAEKAGIQRGDIIIDFNGRRVEKSKDLPFLVARTPVGTKAEVLILREGKEVKLTVVLGELTETAARGESPSSAENSWGMTVADLSNETRQEFRLPSNQKGIVVIQIEPESPAAEAGIRAGDIIEEINRTPVQSVEKFSQILAKASGERTLLVLARRGNFTSFFALRQRDQ